MVNEMIKELELSKEKELKLRALNSSYLRLHMMKMNQQKTKNYQDLDSEVLKWLQNSYCSKVVKLSKLWVVK